ncbi:hypothetical protein V1517DRAFT_248713, partial [Lipomyces orientalis]
HNFPVTSGDIQYSWSANRVHDRDLGINSRQSGLLMQSHRHQMFDDFEFSMN